MRLEREDPPPRSFRFHALPVLEIDGRPVTQSNSLARYVGKLVGLYPTDDLQALYCDEVLDALEDLNHYIVRTFGLEGDELRRAREALVDGWLSVYLRGLAELLDEAELDHLHDVMHRLSCENPGWTPPDSVVESHDHA